jgi:ribosomal protein S18 acetylase RimI-like enzyme
MPITLSQISLADARSFRNCLDTVAREKKYLAQIEAPSYEEVEGFVRESVETDAVQFVALDGSTVVGWADIFPSWAHAVRHCGTLGMGVLPGYRGQGLGKRLLMACIHKAKSKGITRIQLHVRADNDVAIKLYESVGFKHEAIIQNALRFDGVYYEAVQMSLLTEVS